MGLLSDLKIIVKMVLHTNRGNDHAARMDHFYSDQAQGYDDFRKRLLKGRESLWQQVLDQKTPDGIHWIDMGGGTGANLDFFGDTIGRLGKVYVVDLASSLLKVAKQRAEANHWNNVEVVEADATTYVPPEQQVDVVTFSYSLTMIPDWFAAIDHAYSLLKPGGLIGVADFYVSRKHPNEGFQRHNWSKRAFWPMWFAYDNVFPSPDHLPYLSRKFEQVALDECLTRLPYFVLNPFAKMPYYVFVGRKS